MSESSVKVSQALRAIAENVDTSIQQACGHKVGFTLIVFTDERASYISNVDRDQSVAEIKKLLTLWGMGMPDIAAHDFN